MKRISRKGGTTLLEMIVSFGLIALFLLAVTMCMSPLLKMYYRVRSNNEAHGVADALLQSIRADLRTCSGTRDGESTGYLKLRGDDGATVTLDLSGMEGASVEFICSARPDGEMDVLSFAQQIDCAGLSAKSGYGSAASAIQFHKNSGEPDAGQNNYITVSAQELPKRYLVSRFYSINSYNRYLDEYGGQPLFYDAELMRAEKGYMDYTVSVKFAIPAQALEPRSPSEYAVKYVKAEVTLENDRGQTYTMSETIRLSNQPLYRSETTMASD